MASNPISPKVIAGGAGAAGGVGGVSPFVLWLLGVAVWHAPDTAEHAYDAINAVPFPVAGFVLLVLAAAGSVAGGYVTPHTAAPAPTVTAAPQPVDM
jgi:hypothetical protein